MSRWVALVVLVGCFRPSVQSGLPCSEDGSCPAGQVCDQAQSPPLCVETLGDAGVDLDAVDASGPSCSDGCTDPTPVCDQTTQACRGCIADSECSSDVCHELTGECIPEGHAIYIAPNGAGNNCSRGAPCGSISEANNQVTLVRDTIKVADGRYLERIELKAHNGATNIIISGPDRSWDGPEFVATLSSNRVDQSLTLVIEGISIIDTPQDGFDVQGSLTLSHVLVRNSGDVGVFGRGPVTRIFDSRIETSSNRGVHINNNTGVATIERTVITANRGGGLAIENGAAYSVTNTIIAGNGTANSSNPGVRIAGTPQLGSLAVFRFNTVAGNRADIGPTTGIDCNRPVVIESSIIANPYEVFQQEMSPMCTAQTSLFRTNAPGGNLTGDPKFVSTTDFHILPGSPAIDAGPAAAAPVLDVDGDSRTGVDRPDIGADEVP